MEELKPCPFCRSQSVEVWFDLKTPQEAREQNVYCSDCGGRGPTKTEEDWNLTYSDSLTTAAANAWNTRPVEDALRADLARKDELIAALRDSLDAEYDWGIKALEIMCAERNWEHFLGPLKDLQDKCNTARARLAEVEGEK